MPLVITFIFVLLLIFLIVKLKLNTYISLLVTAILLALALGIPTSKIPSVIEAGIGSQLGHLAIVFALGAMIGKLVSDTGGGYRIAQTLIHRFGVKKIQIAVVIASFIVGIALFFEVGLVVLLPILFVVAKELNIPLLYLGIPMAATLNTAHAFLPPHPGPTAITAIFNADMGSVLLIGILVSIPTVIISGPIFNVFLKKMYPSVYHKSVPNIFGDLKEFNIEETPSLTSSVITSMMPVILIGLTTILQVFLSSNSMPTKIISFIGSPDIAMVISLLFALYTMGIKRNKNLEQLSNSLTASVKQIAMMLLIIGGGGALKEVLVQGGIADYVSQIFSNSSLSPILAAWLITAILRVSLGSSTVAGITGAGLVLPMVQSSGVNPALMVLAVGAGSVFADHVNDAGFWMVKEYFGLSLKETLLSWTTLTSILSLSGLASVLLASLFF
ncbi:gluconate:H+ symporter [Leuconostoc pseudomesenteroides]|uniref:gluconate:H+ symporter n=1 Tax=Leuconostoc pseudomesenteroides TaxID=33968 RepID=UPI00166B2A72|nr:gluconate:H+ symporter [Leuconostoc pseudomesenteroides]